MENPPDSSSTKDEPNRKNPFLKQGQRKKTKLQARPTQDGQAPGKTSEEKHRRKKMKLFVQRTTPKQGQRKKTPSRNGSLRSKVNERTPQAGTPFSREVNARTPPCSGSQGERKDAPPPGIASRTQERPANAEKGIPGNKVAARQPQARWTSPEQGRRKKTPSRRALPQLWRSADSLQQGVDPRPDRGKEASSMNQRKTVHPGQSSDCPAGPTQVGPVEEPTKDGSSSRRRLPPHRKTNSQDGRA
jgi:hypothetical protein